MQATRCGRNSVLIRFICQALNATSTFHSFHLLRSISRPPDLLDGVKRLIRAPGRPFARERRHRARPGWRRSTSPARLNSSTPVTAASQRQRSAAPRKMIGANSGRGVGRPSRPRASRGTESASMSVSPSKTLIVSRRGFGTHPVDVLPDEPILTPDSQFSPSSCSSASSPNRGLTVLKRSIIVPFNPLVGDTHHATAAGVDNVSTAHCPIPDGPSRPLSPSTKETCT